MEKETENSKMMRTLDGNEGGGSRGAAVVCGVYVPRGIKVIKEEEMEQSIAQCNTITTTDIKNIQYYRINALCLQSVNYSEAYMKKCRSITFTFASHSYRHAGPGYRASGT